MKKNYFFTLLKGIIIGGTMLVPGVSGGSMAMILGIYNKLISSVSSFFKHKRESLLFLTIFCIGAGVGMLTFAKPLLRLIELYTVPMMYLFMGAVAGAVPMIISEAKVKKFNRKLPLYIIIGLAAVYIFELIPLGKFQSEMEAGILSFMLLMFAGFIAAIALVLPGISVSYLLLVMGLYDETMRAISEVYLPFLLPLAIGVFAGIVLTTKVLEKAMLNFPQPTYMIILGFILGSIAQVFPGIPSWSELIVSTLLLVAGFGIIRLLYYIEVKHEKSKQNYKDSDSMKITKNYIDKDNEESDNK